jgi:hypothetical protein
MAFARYIRQFALRRRSVRIASGIDKQFISNNQMPIGDWFAPFSEMNDTEAREYSDRAIAIKPSYFPTL